MDFDSKALAQLISEVKGYPFLYDSQQKTSRVLENEAWHKIARNLNTELIFTVGEVNSDGLSELLPERNFQIAQLEVEKNPKEGFLTVDVESHSAATDVPAEKSVNTGSVDDPLTESSSGGVPAVPSTSKSSAGHSSWSSRRRPRIPKSNVSSARAEASANISKCAEAKQLYYDVLLKGELDKQEMARVEHAAKLRVLAAEENYWRKQAEN